MTLKKNAMLVAFTLTLFSASVMLVAFTLTLFASVACAVEEVPEVQQQGNIPYVSGGIGEDESDALQAVQHDYNLRVMNADKLGHFSGDVRIVVSDLKHNVLLDSASGPLFYANLPKGRYVVEGFSGEQSRKQTIVVGKGKPAHVRFVWPEDTTD